MRRFLQACASALSLGAALVILGAPSVATAAPQKNAVSAKAKASAKKKGTSSPKATPKSAPGKKVYSAPPPLTAESLGLDTPLASAVPNANAAAAPAPAPAPAEPTPAPAPAPAPEPTAQESAPPIALASTDKDKVLEPGASPRRHLSITINPAPIIAGRYGMNVELVPFRHHAIVASGYYQTFTPAMLRVLMPKAVDTSHGAPAKVGGELGYRFYSGRDGANGFFAGISGVAMPLAYPRLNQDLKSEVVSFYGFGGAVDVGVQAITSAGFTIGGGIGGMYLAYEPPKSVTPPAGVDVPKVAEPHFLPRLLLAAGWSF